MGGTDLLVLVTALCALIGSGGASAVYNHLFDKKKKQINKSLAEVDLAARRLSQLRDLNEELNREIAKLKGQIVTLEADNYRLMRLLFSTGNFGPLAPSAPVPPPVDPYPLGLEDLETEDS